MIVFIDGLHIINDGTQVKIMKNGSDPYQSWAPDFGSASLENDDFFLKLNHVQETDLYILTPWLKKNRKAVENIWKEEKLKASL